MAQQLDQRLRQHLDDIAWRVQLSTDGGGQLRWHEAGSAGDKVTTPNLQASVWRRMSVVHRPAAARIAAIRRWRLQPALVLFAAVPAGHAPIALHGSGMAIAARCPVWRAPHR